MKRKIIVLISWTKLSVLDYVLFSNTVIFCLTGNIKFPNLPATMLALKAATDRLQAAYPNRKKGDDEKVEFKNAKKELNALLHKFAEYVNLVADGNEALILSAGFVPSKSTSTHAGIPDCPGMVKLATVMGGTLIVEVGKVEGAVSYIFLLFLGVDYFIVEVNNNFLTLSPSSIRTILIPDGKLKETVTGLTPGTIVYVQALAQNSAGKSAFSPLSNTIIN